MRACACMCLPPIGPEGKAGVKPRTLIERQQPPYDPSTHQTHTHAHIGLSALWLAAERGHTAVVQRLLREVSKGW